MKAPASIAHGRRRRSGHQIQAWSDGNAPSGGSPRPSTDSKNRPSSAERVRPAVRLARHSSCTTTRWEGFARLLILERAGHPRRPAEIRVDREVLADFDIGIRSAFHPPEQLGDQRQP